ncbi:MAG TPA: hypothetical protein VN224_05515 [Xanthomonadales bacterium]|nr:hypothetical protein [Xanthomonadales bacterium]
MDDQPITDLRGYFLSGDPFITPGVMVAHWFPTLGAFLDAYDANGRYAIVVDADVAHYVAHDIRLGTETNDPSRPLDHASPATTFDARLDFLTDDGAEEGVDVVNVRAIGVVDDGGGVDGA